MSYSPKPATKQRAIESLKKHCPGATLLDESCSSHYDVQLEAPPSHHWDGEVHSRPVHWFNCGNKHDFWGCVLEEIELLPQPVKCEDEDCEGIRDFGECEYWAEETH